MKEYKLVEKVKLEFIQEALDQYSQQGWALHTIIDDGKTPWIRLIFEREIATETPALTPAQKRKLTLKKKAQAEAGLFEKAK